MLRQILARSADPEIEALDAALRRGDLLLAGRYLTQRRPSETSMAWVLREGIYCYLRNDYEKADAAIRQLQDDGALSHYGRFLQMQLALDRRQWAEAQQLHEDLTAVWGEDERKAPFLQLSRALLAFYQGDFDNAEVLVEKILHTSNDELQKWEHCDAQRLAGLIAHQKTGYRRAAALMQNAIKGFRALGDAYGMARSRCSLANTYRRLDDFQQAQDEVQQSIAYFREQETWIPMARCQSVLASIQFHFDHLQQAEKHYQEALQVFEKNRLTGPQITTYINLGLLYRHRGQFKLALHAFAQAQKRLKADSQADTYFRAYLQQSRADLLMYTGKTQEAIQMLHSAGEIYENLGAMAHAAHAWQQLGNHYLEKGKTAKAKTFLEASGKIFLLSEHPVQAAQTSIFLARAALQEDAAPYAMDLLQTAIAILKKHQKQGSAAEGLMWLAEAYLREERIQEARLTIQQARKSSQEAPFFISWQLPYLDARIAFREGAITLGRSRLDEALDALWRLRRDAISALAAGELVKQAERVYHMAIEKDMAVQDIPAGLRHLEEFKAVQLTHRMQSYQAGDEQPEDYPILSHEILGAWQKELTRLRRAMLVAKEEENWGRLAELEQRFNDLAQEWDGGGSTPGYFLQKPVFDIPALQASLDARHGKGEWGCLMLGLLPTAKGAPTLAHFWMNSERIDVQIHHLSQAEAKLLDLAIRPEPSYRKRFLDQPDAKHLWRRIEAFMLPSAFAEHLQKAATIYVSAAGGLSGFPFHALHVDGRPLGLEKNVGQIPSLPVLYQLLQLESSRSSSKRSLRDARGLLCAVSQHQSKNLPNLPHTTQEAFELAALLSDDSLFLLDQAASLPALQAAIANQERQPYHLLHFSTHARFNAQYAMLSHIVLHDDALYVADILAWRLQAALVTLAACDTAMAHGWSGGEQMGLLHAFLIAGAKRVLGSLWPVHDEQSAIFMRHFYTYLQEADTTVGKALLRTRQFMAAQDASPYHWGPYALVGLL